MENVKLTKLWIERFVIGLRLCPFAHYSFYDNTIYYDETSNTKLNQCLADIMAIVKKMQKLPQSQISNAFLIFNAEPSFDKMLLIKERFDVLLHKEELDEEFQIVVFHPNFQFADEDFHASGNFTNRSPLAMMHILRAAEVARAIEATEDVEDIPFRNKSVLEQLGMKKISEVFTDDFMDKIAPYI